MKRFFTLAMTLLLCAAGFAQEATIKWKTEVQHIEDATYSIVFTGKIGSGYHTYGVDNPDSPTSVEFDEPQGYSLSGSLYELSKPSDYEGMKVFFKEIKIAQDIVLLQDEAIIKGEISWLSCTETSCISPEFFNFSISTANAGSSESASVKTQEINAGNTSITAEEESRGFNWALIIEAILWGFAALLTPCVFPMVPMTVSFFMKGSSSPAAGRFKASMYGLFIVLLYTVPISLIILITRVVGGDAVTADIFNWLATHWLLNIIFFIVFMIFAASFFGAFEIVLPSKLVNKSDRGADKGGLLGIFFMSLTLVLV
ncbi:MAG: thiol:disulfide interchange protein, partial [Bacteroidales bacterium]|nr:thiol:disulfide interchange protein [Bacteroidales bacterium]